jgi:hypothetical protein
VILTDAAKAFPSALEILKDKGIWQFVRHLLCRWHVYEAIKRYCAHFFKRFEKGKQMEEFTRFIDGFRAVVLAHTESEMRELWKSFERDSKFPAEAVAYVRIEYYESSKAKKIMECYMSNSGNLHQTSTSRNESAHIAIRSKTSILQSPVESYRLRRQYNDSWIRHLRAKAATAKNRVPLDLQNMLELRNLLGKVSEFALTEIKRQILQARRKEVQGHGRALQDKCTCYVFRRYGLPCLHTVPIDGTPIPLANISSFWYLENFDQRMFFPIY